MRVLMAVVMVVMAGCATNGASVPAGESLRDDGPVSVERLGTMMPLAPSDQAMCHSEQVLLCRGEADDGDCRCVFIYDAERSLQRVPHERQRFRISKPR